LVVVEGGDRFSGLSEPGVGEMSVALRGFDVGVPEDFLDIVERHAGVDHGGGEGVPQVMHSDAINVSGSSGLVPGVEDGLEGLSGAGTREQVVALFGHLVVGLLHGDSSPDGLDGHVIQRNVPSFTGLGQGNHPVASSQVKVLDLGVESLSTPATGQD